MSRAQVRFQANVLRSPDEINSPHHDRAPNPRGILLKSGAFDQRGTRNGKASRRDRRYSTPVEATANVERATIDDLFPRHDYRSRRRSVSGGLLDTSRAQRPDRDSRYEAPAHYYAQTQQASSSRRESLQAVPRPALSTLDSQDPRSSTNRRESKRWHDEGFQVAYEHPAGGSLMPAPPGYPGSTPYYPPSSSLPAGFLYGAATTRSSSAYHSSPGTQNPTRHLPDRDHHRKVQPSLKEIKTARSLHSPRIVWNIAYPFSSALFDANSRLSPSELDQFATTPSGINLFSIKFDHSRAQRLLRSLGWRSMRIPGTNPTQYEGSTVFIVTIRDVINAIFDFFQAPLTREEYARLSNEEAKMVLKSQRKRMGRHAYGFGNPLRVDLLGDYVRFGGVQVASMKDRKIYFALELGRW